MLFHANMAPLHQEADFLFERKCVFRADSFTIWVPKKHYRLVAKAIVEEARAVTENPAAPCLVRKEAPIMIMAAHKLLSSCGITEITVMQYGQKADFGNKVLRWVLTNVRGGGGGEGRGVVLMILLVVVCYHWHSHWATHTQVLPETLLKIDSAVTLSFRHAATDYLFPYSHAAS
jgi:hypothetical protein